MEINEMKPKRTFAVAGGLALSHCADIRLEDDEMVTFITKSGNHFDIVAKSWGFYATPSINGRLKQEGFKTALVKNADGMMYVMIVIAEKADRFNDYLDAQGQKLVEWLS